MEKRRIITIDIETLPGGVDLIGESKSASEGKAAEAYRKTALNGDFGRILCMGVSEESETGSRRMVFLGWDKETETLHGDEEKILRQFWHLMRAFNTSRDHLVGHNIFEFDLR